MSIKPILEKYQYKLLPSIHTVKDNSVDYNFNSDGFRCDEFTNIHNGMHVVFSGCSNTLGIDTDYDKVWSYQTYKQIKKDFEISGYFNLGIISLLIK